MEMPVPQNDYESNLVTIAKDKKLSTEAGGANCLIMENSYIGLVFPVMNSGNCYILASWDGVTYYRLQNSSGTITLAVGTGANCFILDQPFPFRYLGIESATTQSTAAVTIQVATKRL